MTETPSIECADAAGPSPTTLEDTLGYWNALIDEKVAAVFIDTTDRFLQNRRQQGGGPPYIVISSRCIRYRRCDLKAWADARVRVSTSDPGQEAAVMVAPQTKAPAVGAPPPGSDSFSRRHSGEKPKHHEFNPT